MPSSAFKRRSPSTRITPRIPSDRSRTRLKLDLTMDCERFEQHVIDALYEELDDLTAAEFKRHAESCARCAQIFAGLKGARTATALPLEEPSPDLERRILAAERAAARGAPWYFKVMR